MRLVDCEQGTPAWFEARCGVVTASQIADLRAQTRSGWGASRTNYMAQLLAERLTGAVSESYSNAAMQWGTEQEPHAKAAYEFITDSNVDQVGFVLHPSMDMAGASPDGLVGDDGLIEIKCPNTATHVDTLLGQPIPSKYIQQMQWQMLCCERQWCDFVSYDPRLPTHMQLHIQRVERDDDLLAQIEQDVSGFIEELDAKIEALNSKFKEAA